MTTLFYGNGVCTIEGNASGVEIHYEGAIEIDDKTVLNDLKFPIRCNEDVFVIYFYNI